MILLFPSCSFTLRFSGQTLDHGLGSRDGRMRKMWSMDQNDVKLFCFCAASAENRTNPFSTVQLKRAILI